MKEILSAFIWIQDISRQEAYEILTNIAMGKYDSHQIAAFMTAYGMRSISRWRAWRV